VGVCEKYTSEPADMGEGGGLCDWSSKLSGRVLWRSFTNGLDGTLEDLSEVMEVAPRVSHP
jgi:hypothetical protein